MNRSIRSLSPQTRIRLGAAAILWLALSATAWAHHSFAMFDQSKSVTLHGTVKDFRWSNPHVFIQLLRSNPVGTNEEWSIEMTSPEHLARIGWRPDTVKVGDRVTVVIHPTRDGTKGGQYLTGIDPRGPLAGTQRQHQPTAEGAGP